MSLIHTPRPEEGDGPEPRVPVLPIIVLGSAVALGVGWWLTRGAPEKAAPASQESAAAPSPSAEAPPAGSIGTTPVAPSAAAPSATRGGPANTAPAPESKAPATRALLKVTSDVTGAYVFVDRQFVGITPLETANITPGSRHINVSAQGYDGVAQRVNVTADGTTEVRFNLKEVRLDAAVDVVHKHRLGSCEGRLTADIQHLRYTPKSGNDAFVLPLSLIETFSVDYMAKSLVVKMRDGKSWNFTTRADNADPLFVFHRDVDKARSRLSQTN